MYNKSVNLSKRFDVFLMNLGAKKSYLYPSFLQHIFQYISETINIVIYLLIQIQALKRI